MKKPITLLAALAAASAATGCAGISGARGAPDEFRVVTQAPLTLPPDYNLRPPRPGEPRQSELQPNEEARAALFGENVGQSASAGERSFVAHAGAGVADPDIRDTIDFEAQGVVRRNESFVNRLLAFGSGADANTPLNPEQEEQRLADEESIRRATGGAQVIIERERGGFKLPGT